MTQTDFITYYESSGFLDSPSYEESIEYFHKLAKASRYARMVNFGVTAQGREMYCLIVSKGKHFTPKQNRRAGKAVVLIQNGIHPGEIEGKDASMLLLREILITKEKEYLLDNLTLLVIPVLNPDGHERRSEFNRPNQNGPLTMGWRVNAHNLNLNRDYMKADSHEMRALLRLFSQWLPDFIIDNHTTNGADYQYHISYGIERKLSIDSGLARFAETKLIPRFIHDLESAGFLTAPYLDFKGDGPESGLVEMINLPRFSTGYGAVQNRLTLLVETHSLKPFENRVHSTKAMNESVLAFLNAHSGELLKLNRAADTRTITKYAIRREKLPVTFRQTDEKKEFLFKGKKCLKFYSEITGSEVRRYQQEPIEMTVPLFNTTEVVESVQLPRYYIIPKEFLSIIRVLKLHGVQVFELIRETEAECERIRFHEPKITQYPYEGRHRITAKQHSYIEHAIIPAGTFCVPSKQRTARVIAHLLEPYAEDSFFSWGFFGAFLERKEYAEAYIFEPIAKAMFHESAELRAEFESRLKLDPVFRADPLARLDFFYRRSPYFDSIEKKYVILRTEQVFRGILKLC